MVRPSLKWGVETPNRLNLWKVDGLYFRFFASPVKRKGRLLTSAIQITLSGRAHYVLIDIENESGTKNETVTIWQQMTEAFSHVK